MQVKKEELERLRKVELQLGAEVQRQDAELKKTNEALEKEKSTSSMWLSRANEFEAKIHSIHRLLSNLPDPPPEKETDAETWRQPLTPTERLAIWIAKRQK